MDSRIRIKRRIIINKHQSKNECDTFLFSNRLLLVLGNNSLATKWIINC